ncbi:uncharacterized protein L201_006783 [Kwoniella dendrophila CBS 6074]|uniref:Mso1 N-terminal domain-containing protein n=1 Tax=Kwoniella dendrophila CBS 6074 TaxID=1295534 RepID=A0AAX4K2M3_9TREE
MPQDRHSSRNHERYPKPFSNYGGRQPNDDEADDYPHSGRTYGQYPKPSSNYDGRHPDDAEADDYPHSSRTYGNRGQSYASDDTRCFATKSFRQLEEEFTEELQRTWNNPNGTRQQPAFVGKTEEEIVAEFSAYLRREWREPTAAQRNPPDVGPQRNSGSQSTFHAEESQSQRERGEYSPQDRPPSDYYPQPKPGYTSRPRYTTYSQSSSSIPLRPPPRSTPAYGGSQPSYFAPQTSSTSHSYTSTRSPLQRFEDDFPNHPSNKDSNDMTSQGVRPPRSSTWSSSERLAREPRRSCTGSGFTPREPTHVVSYQDQDGGYTETHTYYFN